MTSLRDIDASFLDLFGKNPLAEPRPSFKLRTEADLLQKRKYLQTSWLQNTIVAEKASIFYSVEFCGYSDHQNPKDPRTIVKHSVDLIIQSSPGAEYRAVKKSAKLALSNAVEAIFTAEALEYATRHENERERSPPNAEQFYTKMTKFRNTFIDGTQSFFKKTYMNLKKRIEKSNDLPHGARFSYDSVWTDGDDSAFVDLWKSETDAAKLRLRLARIQQTLNNRFLLPIMCRSAHSESNMGYKGDVVLSPLLKLLNQLGQTRAGFNYELVHVALVLQLLDGPRPPRRAFNIIANTTFGEWVRSNILKIGDRRNGLNTLHTWITSSNPPFPWVPIITKNKRVISMLANWAGFLAVQDFLFNAPNETAWRILPRPVPEAASEFNTHKLDIGDSFDSAEKKEPRFQALDRILEYRAITRRPVPTSNDDAPSQSVPLWSLIDPGVYKLLQSILCHFVIRIHDHPMLLPVGKDYYRAFEQFFKEGAEHLNDLRGPVDAPRDPREFQDLRADNFFSKMGFIDGYVRDHAVFGSGAIALRRPKGDEMDVIIDKLMNADHLVDPDADRMDVSSLETQSKLVVEDVFDPGYGFDDASGYSPTWKDRFTKLITNPLIQENGFKSDVDVVSVTRLSDKGLVGLISYILQRLARRGKAVDRAYAIVYDLWRRGPPHNIPVHIQQLSQKGIWYYLDAQKNSLLEIASNGPPTLSNAILIDNLARDNLLGSEISTRRVLNYSSLDPYGLAPNEDSGDSYFIEPSNVQPQDVSSDFRIASSLLPPSHSAAIDTESESNMKKASMDPPDEEKAVQLINQIIAVRYMHKYSDTDMDAIQTWTRDAILRTDVKDFYHTDSGRDLVYNWCAHILLVLYNESAVHRVGSSPAYIRVVAMTTPAFIWPRVQARLRSRLTGFALMTSLRRLEMLRGRTFMIPSSAVMMKWEHEGHSLGFDTSRNMYPDIIPSHSSLLAMAAHCEWQRFYFNKLLFKKPERDSLRAAELSTPDDRNDDPCVIFRAFSELQQLNTYTAARTPLRVDWNSYASSKTTPFSLQEVINAKQEAHRSLSKARPDTEKLYVYLIQDVSKNSIFLNARHNNPKEKGPTLLATSSLHSALAAVANAKRRFHEKYKNPAMFKSSIVRYVLEGPNWISLDALVPLGVNTNSLADVIVLLNARGQDKLTLIAVNVPLYASHATTGGAFWFQPLHTHPVKKGGKTALPFQLNNDNQDPAASLALSRVDDALLNDFATVDIYHGGVLTVS